MTPNHLWIAGLILSFMAGAALLGAEETKETFGCEANPTGDPMGGGAGYRDIKTTGDFVVKTKDELLAALKAAKPGQVIFTPDGVEMDLTGQTGVYLPQGVTLAGTRGLNGSLGARLFTTDRTTYPLFRTGGYGVRLTGLRFEGPFGERGRVPHYSCFFTISHPNVEVDNCEVYNWNTAGIEAVRGAAKVRVHHCYIHHCQQDGMGYGVVMSECDVYIIANIFDWCRHNIASGGGPGSAYEAAWNLVRPNTQSYHFDVHGGRDRGDGTEIASDWVDIHHNTFEGPARAVWISGVPSQGGEVHHNWFHSESLEKAVKAEANTRVYRNAIGPEKKLTE